jgi:PKD repeat protein/subtilisin-like proprotein convertase family protein
VQLFAAQGQTFSNNTGGTIPDNNTLTFYPVTVSGLPVIIDSVNFGLLSVCINISHTYDANLDIYIKSPDGVLVKLVNNRGANGRNFIDCCLKENGTIPIGQGIATFTGSFIPEETINTINNRQNPNGIWYLGVHDEVPFNSGRVNNFSINFGNNPPPTPVDASICTITNGRSCKCPDGTQNCDLLPDITNSQKVIEQNNIEFNGYLQIGVGTPNIGYGPIEVRGTSNCYCDSVKVSCNRICPNGSSPKQEVTQRIYKKNGATITYVDKPAGSMQYHPAHGHIHLDDWTLNSLRLSGPESDPLKWPLIGTDKKVSFCLVNLSDCNAINGACKDKNGNTLTYNQTGNPGMGIISGCGTEQGIYPGYMDIYYPGFEGQDIFFGNICNGWYNIVSVTDPKNLITEMDETNNTAIVPIFLFQQQDNCCHTDFGADTLVGVAPFKVQFADKSMPLSSKWQWNFGDGSTATTAFPIHTYTQPGIYDVSLHTDAKDTNCKDSLTKKKYIIVKPAATNSNQFNIRLYPSPFKNQLAISYQLQKSQMVQISYFDVTGRQLLKLPATQNTAGLHEQLINTSSWPAGIYVIKVKVDNDVRTIKAVKQ